MRSILDEGKDIVAELGRTGNPELLKHLFKLRTQDWEYHIMSNEFGTVGAFSDLSKMSSINGFNLISTSVEIVLEQVDPNFFITALSLLLECICISKTTEMPYSLSEKLDELKGKIIETENEEAQRYLDSILHWYRV
ncbi:MAG: hypothetical protein Q8880_12495 [Bacteroidota bacterium]|nr:hypothetical protein [Bacteroidota bacterium]